MLQFVKTIITSIIIALAFVVNAQTTNTNPPPSFWGGLQEAGQAAASWFQASTNQGQTNWIGIAYGSYDVSQKKIGYGAAAIYPVNSLLYIGVRVENLNGTWTTPSLQVQVKKTVHFLGLDETLFGVGGTAIVSGNVAAYTGAGAYIGLFSPVIAGKARPIGLVGDYETWGGLPAGCGTHRVNAGLSVGF